MRPLRLTAAAGALGALALAAWPTAVRPVRWTPSPVRALPPAAAPAIERLDAGGAIGPEDVAVLPDGAVIAGALDGTLLRWSPSLDGPTPWAHTGGRPLGLEVAPDGRLLVADGVRGLLAVDASGRVEVLVDEVAGRPVRFADDVAVDGRGRAWFSDASDRFDVRRWKDDVLESAPNGRLCAVDLATGEATEALTGLHFANGVAVGPDDAFVLVVETSRYRVTRLWLDGPLAGEVDTFVDGLPGFPDGVSFDGERFWLALAAPRDPVVDALAPHPAARALVAKLPDALRPSPARHTWLLGLGTDGTVVAHLHAADPAPFAVVTSVQRHGDWLWLGSLHEGAVARARVP